MLNLSCNELNRALIPKLPASPGQKFTKVQRQETVNLALWYFSSIEAICKLIINFMLASTSRKEANHAGSGDEKCGVIRARHGLFFNPAFSIIKIIPNVGSSMPYRRMCFVSPQ
jgi:hypothetical protein